MKNKETEKYELLMSIDHWTDILMSDECDDPTYRKMIVLELLKVINKLV